ncbi:hypothetical protein GCM10017559_15240 [Streptosporangium longisporum]|uniref:Uncharacterized protein n=1 Tax=Streptosporangium longisporum TaxID=46187 RepID=A0ABN3XTN0_9ACTN
MFVTVVPARTAKFPAVPSGTGVAAAAVPGAAVTHPSATAPASAPASQERTIFRGMAREKPMPVIIISSSFGISPFRRIADDAPFFSL